MQCARPYMWKNKRTLVSTPEAISAQHFKLPIQKKKKSEQFTIRIAQPSILQKASDSEDKPENEENKLKHGTERTTIQDAAPMTCKTEFQRQCDALRERMDLELKGFTPYIYQFDTSTMTFIDINADTEEVEPEITLSRENIADELRDIVWPKLNILSQKRTRIKTKIAALQHQMLSSRYKYYFARRIDEEESNFNSVQDEIAPLGLKQKELCWNR